MTKKPRERSPATACNVISLGSLRGWLTLMRRDTRWRKLEAPPSSLPSRTKERLIIASLNNDNAFSLIIYIYIPPRYIVAPRLTVAAVYMDLFQFYFIPEINRLSTRFVERNVVSLLPPNPGREKGKTWIKNWGEREGEKSSRPVPLRSRSPFRSRSSSTRLFTRGVANYSTREGIHSKASSNHPVPGTRYHCKRSPPPSPSPLLPLQGRRVYLA